MITAVAAYGLLDRETELRAQFIVPMVLMGWMIAYQYRDLRGVVLRDETLLVTGGRKRASVPIALVRDVWQNTKDGSRLVHVELREEVPNVGRRFVFLPRRGWNEPGWRVDSVVRQLRQRAGLAVPGT